MPVAVQCHLQGTVPRAGLLDLGCQPILDPCRQCVMAKAVPVDMCQVDVVYIDGCDDVNDPSSYLTLCANCQTFRAAMNDDDLSPEDRAEVREAWTLGDLFN